MFNKIKNVVGVSLILIVAFILLIGFLEKKFDTRYYEEEDCVEAVVTYVSEIKESGRYSYNAIIEYTTPKGKEGWYYLTKLSDRSIKKGKKLLVGCDEDGDATLVKRDFLTGKYVKKSDHTNAMLVPTVGVLIAGLVCFILIPNAQGMIVSIITMLQGIALCAYSFMHSDTLQVVIMCIGIGLAVISFLLVFIQRNAVKRENDKLVSSINISDGLSKNNQLTLEELQLKAKEKSKKNKPTLRDKWIGLGNKRYIYLSIFYFTVAVIISIIATYLIWGRGEYSGYKYADAVVIEVDEFHTYEDDEIIRTRYAATLEYVTETGEKRTLITEYEFEEDDVGSEVGDELSVGYKGASATILEENMYTGRYEPYDKSPSGWYILAGIFVLIGTYMMTKLWPMWTKRFTRGIGWMILGMLFEFSAIISSGVDQIMLARSVFTVIGLYKCAKAYAPFIWERKELKEERKKKERGTEEIVK